MTLRHAVSEAQLISTLATSAGLPQLEGRVGHAATLKRILLATGGRKSVLTAAEARVLELISLGLTEKEIAGRLCVSTSTVHTHVKSIFRKLRVNNKVSAAVWYVRHERGSTFQSVDRAPFSVRSLIRLLPTEDKTFE